MLGFINVIHSTGNSAAAGALNTEFKNCPTSAGFLTVLVIKATEAVDVPNHGDNANVSDLGVLDVKSHNYDVLSVSRVSADGSVQWVSKDLVKVDPATGHVTYSVTDAGDGDANDNTSLPTGVAIAENDVIKILLVSYPKQ